MMKINKVNIAHIITVICILIASALLYCISSNIFSGFRFDTRTGQGTTIDFISNDGAGVGFNRETIIYTEKGITSITFSGKISVDGTAQISVVSDDDGSIIYSKTYSDIRAKTIDFEVTGLAPYCYYTLRFSSGDGKAGKLALTTDQSLVKHPVRPEKSTPPIPNKE